MDRNTNVGDEETERKHQKAMVKTCLSVVKSVLLLIALLSHPKLLFLKEG